MNAFRTFLSLVVTLVLGGCAKDFSDDDAPGAVGADPGAYDTGNGGNANYVDRDGDGWPVDFDCNDSAAAVSPGAPELCNGIDDNCDGAVDNNDDCDDGGSTDGSGDGGGSTDDADGDGYNDVDCDDTRADVYPGAPEYCDGRDNDCDGVTDEGCDSGGGSGSGSGSGSGTVTVEVTTDSSWCGTWELWAFNESEWTGRWPGLSSPDYLATGSADALSGSITGGSADQIWIQGECGGSSWLAENTASGPVEHVSAIRIDGVPYVVNYSATDDTPAAGECTKRSTAFDIICRVR